MDAVEGNTTVGLSSPNIDSSLSMMAFA